MKIKRVFVSLEDLGCVLKAPNKLSHPPSQQAETRQWTAVPCKNDVSLFKMRFILLWTFIPRVIPGLKSNHNKDTTNLKVGKTSLQLPFSVERNTWFGRELGGGLGPGGRWLGSGVARLAEPLTARVQLQQVNPCVAILTQLQIPAVDQWIRKRSL